jgi:hypothetical protein
MKVLYTIFSDVRKGENIDIYLSILAGVVIFVMDLLGVVQLQSIIAVTLLVLSLLSLSNLGTRRTLAELNITIQKLEGKRGAASFLRDRNSYHPLTQTIAAARKVYIAGPTLINVFSTAAGYIHAEKLNNQGATVQILLLDPESSAINSAAKCMNESVVNLRKDIRRTLSYVETWLTAGVQSGSVVVKLMSAHLNMGMVLLDPDEEDGRIFVEFIGYASRLHSRPHIELTRQNDAVWYEYYFKQYQKLWDDSTVKLTS